MQANKNMAGFSLLGVLIAVMIIGILAAIAVPRFTSAIALANTARIQSDLSSIDAAVAMYRIDNGKNPSGLGDLDEYLSNAAGLKPPVGDCYIKSQKEKYSLEGAAYTLSAADDKEGVHALCAGKGVAEFGKPDTAASSSATPGKDS